MIAKLCGMGCEGRRRRREGGGGREEEGGRRREEPKTLTLCDMFMVTLKLCPPPTPTCQSRCVCVCGWGVVCTCAKYTTKYTLSLPVHIR